MRRASRLSRARPVVLALSLSVVGLTGACGADGGPGTDAVLFENARILIGDGSAPIENGAFLVEAGRFTHVGQTGAIDVPRGAQRVDLGGRTVMPALINTHAHLGSTRAELIAQLGHFAFWGVGAVQSLGHDSAAMALEMRSDTTPGIARYLTAGRGITAPEPGRTETPYWVTSAEQARAAVRELAAARIPLLKIWVDDRNGQYEKLGPELYGAVIDEAHANGQRVAAHIFSLEDAKGLLRAGVDAFAHGIRDTDIDDEGLALFRERPDVVLIPNLPDRGEATDVGWLAATIPAGQLEEIQAAMTDRPDVQQRFAIQARNLGRLNEAGVRIAMGTDGSAAWAAHVEMEDMVAAGMSPARVIVASTRNGARLLGLEDTGTIEVGRSADFIVLDADPLEDIRNTRRINAVWLRGAPVDRAAISARQLAGT